MSRRVVVVGGGFAGLLAARGLRGADGVDVTLVDRENFFLFQPLAYQVATGALSSVEIAAPLRQVLRRSRSTHVVLGEATGFDLDRRVVVVERLPNGDEPRELPYDTLVVAGGSRYSYFGHDHWAPYAPELKSLDGALELRDRILSAFEAAEVERDPAKRAAFLTFVIVGAGPTGVEMAGQIAELSRRVLRNEYRSTDTAEAQVLLVEAGERVLASYPPRLSHSAERQLRSLGVTPVLSSPVTDVGDGFVELQDGGQTRRIETRTVVWAAGVRASPLAAALADAAGLGVDRAGRLEVEPDLTLPGRPEVFAIGDMVTVRGQTLPGIAPVAMQQGRHVAAQIRSGTHTPFRYRNKGELATIGRRRAVGVVAGVPVSGLAAWLLWLGVHITYLVGFQNRVLVLTRWAFAYLTSGRGARVIHGR
ncbi:MAG TPA: NAD(P)/FAD-dependent oxidoreductase [Gaiellaceae bacterium]|nr:NAD(P)/FAD-dependent oxidoreductase [Gaiellaceae bacterium]